METIAFVLDIFVVIAAFAAYLNRPRIGGQLFDGLQRVMYGVLLLGIAHLSEIMLPIVLEIDPVFNEVLHGLLEGGALVFLILGFNRMRETFRV